MDNTDASDNTFPVNTFPRRIIQILNELGQPGDTFTIESTYVTPDSNNATHENIGFSNIPGTIPIPTGNQSDNISEEEETEVTQTNTIPVENIYNEMARLFSMPLQPHEDGLSSNIINSEPLLSTSAPTTRREIRRRRSSYFPSGMNRNPINSVVDNDVNSDYENFITSLFTTNIAGSNINNILARSLLDPSQNVYKNVISEEGEGEIEYFNYRAEEYPEQKSCPMTLMEFKDGDEIAKLPCGHIFSAEPILKWLKKENSRCPVCRKELSSKEVKKDIKIHRRPRSTATNRRYTSRDFISHMVNSRIRREEENELQRAIMASLRDNNDS